MDDACQRMASLSPEERALFELLLTQEHAAHTPMETIPRRDTTAPCVLSFAQQRLWFLEQLAPQRSLYHVHRAVRWRGPLHVEALQQALNTIVRRHETLRTTFVAVDGSPVQIITEPRAAALAIIDLSACSPIDQEAEVQRLCTQERQRRFDLTADVMLRASLLRLGVDAHILLLVIHHIAADGWSMGVLLRELSVLYNAFSAGKPPRLAALPMQYADFASWQRQCLQGEWLDSQLAYWRQQLQGAPPLLALPTDWPRPAVQTFRSQVAAHPEQDITSYSLVTPAARQLLPDPRIVLEEPPQDIVTNLFARWAHDRPAQVAVSQGERTWTYGELATTAGHLAHTLVARGLTAGDVVAVYGRPSFGVIASMLGVLWSGGVLLLIDPHLPEPRQQLMCQEAAAKRLIAVASEPLAAAWLAQQVTLDVLCVDAATGRHSARDSNGALANHAPLDGYSR